MKASKTSPAAPQRRDRRAPLVLAAVAMAVLVIAAYSNFFENSFHFDDSHVIENNLYIRSLSNSLKFFQTAATFSSLPQNATYRPLLSLTYAIDYRLGNGLAPFQFHLTQLILLLVLGAMLIRLFAGIYGRTLDRPWTEFAAVAASALFCLHPANTETMNFISSRSDLLSTIFVVLAFLVYLRFKSARVYYLYLIPIVVGALVKAPVVMFAPLLLVYLLLFGNVSEAARKGRESRRYRFGEAMRETAPSFVLGALLLWFLNSMNLPEWTSGGGDRWAYLRTQAWVSLHYLRLFILPVGLTADSDLTAFRNWYDTRMFAGLAFLILLLVIAFRTGRRDEQRPIAFGIAWFLIALFPTTSIFPLAEVVNEHRIFFPYIGLVLAAVWATMLCIERMRERDAAGRAVLHAAAAAITFTVLLIFAFSVHARNRVWKTEESLWLDVTEKSPGNGRALMNYGLTQMQQGRYAVAKDYFERALALAPNYSTLEINLGVVNGALGDQATAEQHFKRALQLKADSDSNFYYARWLSENGRVQEAIPLALKSMSLSPAASNPRDLLMRIYAAAGRKKELDALVADTLAIAPGDPTANAYGRNVTPDAAANPTYDTWFKLGNQQLARKDYLNAVQSFRRALDLNRSSADAWNNLGWALFSLGLNDEAVAAYETALKIDPKYDRARSNLQWLKDQSVKAGKR
ncbi:MAG: tetratricopeptide repeat protein [Acidobacteriota bacterium]